MPMLDALLRGTAQRKAAEALRAWLAATAITPADLQARLDAGEPLLAQALATVSPADLAQYRDLMVRAFATFADEDYAGILEVLARDPAWVGHAQILLAPHYYWHHFVPALHALRARVTGSPDA